MDEKHITFENLKTVISPVKHLIQQNTDLIEKKSDWNELKNKPFYTAENGTVHKISSKYIPGLTAQLNGHNIIFERDSSNFITSGGNIDYYTFDSSIYNSSATSSGSIEITRYGSATSSQAGSGGKVLSSNYAQANGLGTVVNTNYGNAIGTYNNYFEFDVYTKAMTLNIGQGADPYTWFYTQIAPVYNKATGLFELSEYNRYWVDSPYEFIKGDIIFCLPKYDIELPYITNYYLITKVIEQNKARATLEVVYHYTSRDNARIAGREGPYVHIVGNGTDDENRSNAHTLDWDGNAWYAGNVYVGSNSGTNKDDGSKKLATEEYVDAKIDKFKNTPFIEGTGVTDETNKISTWIGSSDEITEYYDGLTIKYKIGVEGQSTVTLNINGLGTKTVYRFNTTKLTTQFPVGSIINLIYHTDLNGGCWITNDYDANTNTQQRVYESSTKNVEYPITARYATTSGSTYYAEYGRYSAGVTLNPSKNTITATTFNGNLNGTATKATQDSHGNVIVDAYATKDYVQQEFASKALTLTGLDAEGISHTWTIYGVAQ